MNKLQLAKIDRTAKFIKDQIRDMTTQYGMTRKQAKQVIKENTPDAFYMNELYVVSVFKNSPHGIGEQAGEVWHLSIRRQDREACHDWRHFQQIKNEICGTECEGLELYPSESRVLDAANQYHIYVFMNPEMKIAIGYNDIDGNGRDSRNVGKSKQRPFEKDSEK